MEQLPHDPLLRGDFKALGDRFHPVSEKHAAVMLDALGELPWPVNGDGPRADPTPYSWTLLLELPIAVIVYMVSKDGHRLVTKKFIGGTPGKPVSQTIYAPDGYPYTYILVEAATGAYITGCNAKSGDEITVSPATLRPINNPGLPNAPGELPKPSRDGTPLPADSPPVLVGIGEINKHILIRTQYWQKSDSSYSLPGCSSLTVTRTETTGLTQSSSEMKEIATTIGISTSLGWGPISSSISASMSRSSSSTQELTITSELESTVVQAFTNAYQSAMVVLLWQLVDRIAILTPSPEFKIKGVIETLVLPTIPKAYDVFGNPFPPPNAMKCIEPDAVRSAIEGANLR